jgi:uncharacterized YigZ family protein
LIQGKLLVPAGEAQVEIQVVNSRFIACASPATSVEKARSYIQHIKGVYPDATHHVPAFIIGHGASVISHCSDDGEPSGTAGRPILTVLNGSGLGDVVVVVVRYFGGTKLGTGGLVRAYTEATQRVLGVLPRAVKVSTTTLMFELEYAQLVGIRRLVKTHNGVILDEDFQANIWMTVRFITEDVTEFQAALTDFSRGSIQAEVLEIIPDSIFPISSMDDSSTALPENGGDTKR